MLTIVLLAIAGLVFLALMWLLAGVRLVPNDRVVFQSVAFTVPELPASQVMPLLTLLRRSQNPIAELSRDVTGFSTFSNTFPYLGSPI